MNIPPTLPDNARTALRLLAADRSTSWEVAGLTLERYLFDQPEQRELIELLRDDEIEDLLAGMINAARLGAAEDAKQRLIEYLEEHRFEIEVRSRPELEPLEMISEPAPESELVPAGVEIWQ